MKRLICVYSLSVLCFLCYSQETKKVIEESFRLLEQKDYKKFELTYLVLYQEYLKENDSDYQNAIVFTKEKQFDSAFVSINNLINNGLFLDEIKEDNNFQKLHSQKDWTALLNRIKNITQSYDEKLRIELKEIQNKDQSIRILYMAAKKKKNDSLTAIIHDYMKKIDIENIPKIQEILDKYGWLGADKIGSEANETLFLGVQHVDDLIVQEKYLPLLKKAVKAGDAEPWHLAFLTDRVLMNQGKKQIYGTQVILSDNPENSYVVPLENPDEVDKWRQEIGLGTLKDYLKEDGIDWDLQIYKQNLPRIEKLYKERSDKLIKTN